MKKNLLSVTGVLLLVALVLFGSQSFLTGEAMASDEVKSGLVTVSGTGSISVKPDMGTITIGVETQDKDANKAQIENKENMLKVMETLEAMAIKEEDIKTIQFNIYDQYNYFENKEAEKYYVVTNLVKVTIHDLEKMGEVIDGVTKAGSNKISNIQFGISNEEEVYGQALKLAMTSAESKANALLSTFDKTASIPSKIIENGYSVGVVRESYDGVMLDKSTPINTGALTVTAQISVEYDY